MNILSPVVGRDGCSGYRVRKPFEAMSDLGHETWILENGTSGEKIIEAVQGADVIVFRQHHDKFFRHLKTQNDIDVSQKLFVVDLDDDIYNINPFSDSYTYGGLQEVEWKGKKLWEDGRDGFDIARNRATLDSIENMLYEADLITVTTDYLKERVKEISGNDNVAVLPNAIDFNHWKKWPFKDHRKEIRIGWTGGSSHYEDWHSIKDSLKEVFDEYDNLKLVIQGCKWEGTLKDIPYEFHKWIDFDGHPYKSASLDLDIGLIPLVDNAFNRAKSCIKWYEYSALGVPSLVSNVTPYKEEVDGKAMVYNNQEEFKEGLRRLIENRKLRKDIASKAQKWVKKNRNLENIAKKYIKTYEDNKGTTK